MVWAKNIFLKKCVNHNKSNLRQNSVKGQKDPNSAKIFKKKTWSSKLCQKNPPKRAKSWHNSLSWQNRVQFSKDFKKVLGKDRIFFTKTLIAFWYFVASLSFTCSSCFKGLFTKKKLNNYIVEIHKDPKSWISGASWGTRSPATCHPSLFARTVQQLWQERF